MEYNIRNAAVADVVEISGRISASESMDLTRRLEAHLADVPPPEYELVVLADHLVVLLGVHPVAPVQGMFAWQGLGLNIRRAPGSVVVLPFPIPAFVPVPVGKGPEFRLEVVSFVSPA